MNTDYVRQLKKELAFLRDQNKMLLEQVNTLLRMVNKTTKFAPEHQVPPQALQTPQTLQANVDQTAILVKTIEATIPPSEKAQQVTSAVEIENPTELPTQPSKEPVETKRLTDSDLSDSTTDDSDSSSSDDERNNKLKRSKNIHPKRRTTFSRFATRLFI